MSEGQVESRQDQRTTQTDSLSCALSVRLLSSLLLSLELNECFFIMTSKAFASSRAVPSSS